MSPGVTKECFPPATHCHNCVRKIRDIVTEKKDCEDLKRCSTCHLMTYCDQDCQKEHWNAVHKHHCRFLSGKKVVTNAEHSPISCIWCITRQEENPREILNVNSPKTTCHIEKLIECMKLALGSNFEFHEEGKTCGCSLKFACNLPFSLGEVCGQYVGKGIDEMIAHAIRLVYAMCLKKRSDTVDQALHDLVGFRVVLWRRVLTLGESGSERPGKDTFEVILRLVKDLDKIFGSNNAWFKALKFSIDIVSHMHRLQHYSTIDLRDLDDPRFQNLKKGYQNDEPQIKNVLHVSQKKLWTNFKLWPILSGGQLVLQLPHGIRCDSCTVELKGEVAVTEGQMVTFRPFLKAAVGSTGGLVAICSKQINSTCSKIYMVKNPKLGVAIEEPHCELLNQEWNSLIIKSRKCDVCLIKSLSSHRCSKCLAAQYCSTECQMKDLNFHRTVCADRAKDSNKKMVSSSQQKKAFKKDFKSFVDQKTRF